MLNFGREEQHRGMGKTKPKNAVSPMSRTSIVLRARVIVLLFVLLSSQPILVKPSDRCVPPLFLTFFLYFSAIL